MAKKETTIDAAALRAEFLGEDAPNNKEVSAETTSKGIDAAALRAEYLSNSAEESDADPTLGLKIGGIATRAGMGAHGLNMRSVYNRKSALDGIEATDAASQSVANMVGEARKRGYMEAEQKRLKPLYDYLESGGDAGEGIKPIDFTQSTLGKSVEEMMPKSGQYIPRGKALLDIMDKNSGVTDKSEMYSNTDRLRAMYMLNPNMAKDSQHVEWNEHYPAPTTPIMTPSEDGLYHIGENTYTHEDMVNALAGYMPVAQHNRLLKYNEHYRDDYARSLGYKSWDDAWETPLKNLTKELEAINEELASETYDKMVAASAFETAPATEGAALGTYIADMMRGGLTAQQELEKAKALTADDFISGFDEGFNTVEVMSLGYAGIGASVNLYNILEKVNNGQALSEREEKVYRAYEIGQELEQLHNEFRGGKMSRGRRWGQGVGTSTEAMAQFAASMAATGGIGSGIAAANTGIKQAFKQGLKSGLKQTVKMGGKKAGVYGARSAAAASFSPMTYSTFADRRVGQYHIDESGNLVKETRPWAKDLGIAYVETFNEYFSEYFGNGMGKLIDVSPSKIGRVFGLDKWAGKKGYGNIGDYLDATFVPTKRMREAMHHVDFAGFVWEAPSEAFGDFMSSLMLAPFSEEHGFEQFATKEYWEDLYGTTAIFGGSLSVLGAPATIKNMYNTSKNVKRREAALGKIQDVELRNNLKSVMSLDSMEEMSQAMVDLHIEKLSPDQAAAAVEYLTSATMVKVLTGADMEDTRLLALDDYVKNANNIVYKGKDGSLPSDEIIQVVDKNGRELFVEAGDVNNTSDVSMLKCKAYDAENRKWVDVAVPASEVMGMKRESVEQVISAEYERMFGTEIMAERLKEIEGARKSMENPSAEVVRGHYLRNGLKVYDTGAEVSLADGRTAVVESMLADGSYLVRSVNPTTQTEELYEVPFMQVLQPEASLAEAQKHMFAKNIESATQSIERAEATEQSAEAGVAEEEDVDADMEDVVEQAQEMPKPVPTREDGSVDFSAIEDPKMFATEYTKKMGGEDKAKASVAKMAANARAEASQLREKSDKMTDPNAVVDAVAKADAMDARADFYDKVLAEYAPQEEVQSEAYKAGDVVEYDGRIAEVVGEENEGVVIADAQGRMTVVDPTTLSRVAEAPAEENAVDLIEDADDKLIEETEAGIVQNVFGKMLDARTANVIDAMAKALGVKVAFVENVTTQAGTRANADIKGNVVRIAWAQRKKAISFLAGHEFTHRMKDMSPEAYAEFTKSVKEYLGEAEWQRRMDAQRATYELHNRRAEAEGKPLLSYEDTLLEEEVVADFVGDMVENRHAFEYYVQKQSQKPSLLQAIKKVLSAIGRFFRRMGARTEAQRMKEMIAHLDTFINKAREEAKKKGVQGSDARFSLSSTPIFFSNAQYAVQNIKQEKATPEQWLKMIEKNGGLKAGEDKWLGLSDWLKASDKKSLTKDEVLQYIAENDIQIEEVEYAQFGPGLIDEATRKLEAEMREIGIDAMREKYNGFDDLFEVYNNELVWSENMASESEYEDFIIGNNIVDVNAQANAINETRSGYTTNGLTNKREIALVVPTIEPYNAHDEVHFGDAGGGRAVAWIRFGETTDADGKRVLVIDEIQSKRHQDGREKGYRGEIIESYERRGYKIIRNASDDGWLVFEGDKFLDLVSDRENRGVPTAPFEKNWAELAFKRMLRYAAENGYDYVAWTTGDQQAKRYDLSKKVDSIIYKANDNGTYRVSAILSSRMSHKLGDEIPQQELSNYVGKELADRIINSEGYKTSVSVPWPDSPYEFEKTKVEEWNALSGGDLKVGGEGMRGFYDQMLPSFVKKYTKKWGAEVGEVTMPDLAENNTMHAVNVTDSMRESVMQGQPKFSLSEETTQIFDAAKAKFGTTYDMREAGYILPDGSMLDFSGRHQVEGDASFLNGDRTVDHREIADIAYDNDDNETGINTDLGDFLDRGAIRIDSNAGAINLNVAPTKAQKDRLKRLIERNDGYVYIDFGKGWDTEHYAEYEAARASRVLGDIDRYFDEGIKPAGNVRFSLQETNDRFNAELATLTEENAREKILNVGTPSSILLACGIENKPIRLYGAKLLSKVRKHGYDLDDLKNLPLAMSEPIAVFDGSKPNSFAILTELRVGDNNILAALSVGKGGHDVDFNIISSVYDKRGDSVARWVNDGKMLWVDKKKALDYFSVSAPIAEAQNNQELISTANIIQNFQNPKIEAKNSLITPEMDAAYLDAVNRGDMETAQRMVMEAAKLAMPNTKVVDEDGNPKVVYHGTPNNFNAFSKEMFGTSTDRGIWGNGFYFSDSEQYAKTYEKRGDKQGRTLTVFLNIENPLFISLRNGGNEGAMYFHELMEKHFTDDIYEDATRTDELMSVAQERLTADIVANGYDGIVVEYTNHIDTEYVAFEPNQIKSADPVTYDDAGNIIPLSERFNPEKEDIRYSLIGEQGASALDKAEEATIRLDNLAVARDMEAVGEDAKAIRMATGWERGADGLWRYEIMDAGVNLYDGDENTIRKKIEVAEEEEKDFMQQSKADTKELRERTNTYLAEMREKYGVAEGEETDVMTEEEIDHLQSLTGKEVAFEDYKERRRNELYNRRMALEAQLAYVIVKNTDAPVMILTSRLGHVLKGEYAEQLFKAYPSLKDMEFRFVTDIQQRAFAAYAIDGGKAYIELNVKKTPVNMVAPYLMHEVQHAIQAIEGFANGGNLSTITSKKERILEAVAKATDYKMPVYDNYGAEDLENALTKNMQSYRPDTAYGVVYKDAIQSVAERFGYEDIYALINDWDNIEGKYDTYKRIAGEVEARNVSARLNMTPEERRATLLSETEDVAREDQIFLRESVMQGQPKFSLAYNGDVARVFEDAIKIARSYNIPQDIIVAGSLQDYKTALLSYGVPEEKIILETSAVYLDWEDVIVVNAVNIFNPAFYVSVLAHENMHAITRREKDKVEAIAKKLPIMQILKFAEKEFGYSLDYIKNNLNGVSFAVVDEIISTFVEQIAAMPVSNWGYVLRRYLTGSLTIDEAMEACELGIAELYKGEYEKLTDATKGLLRENLIKLRDEQYKAEKVGNTIFWGESGTSNGGGIAIGEENKEDLRAQSHAPNGDGTTERAEADRRGEGADAQEVGYRHSIEEIIDTPSDEEYKQQMLEFAQQMERDAEERNLDKAQEIADVTGWVHLDDGTWQYYGNVDITEDAKESTRVRRWLESKAAVKKARTRKMYDDLLKEQKKVTKELESESKARRSNASYAKAVDAILQGQAHEALPIEDQILVDVALGQKLRWEDEQGGSRRGLKTELGLRSTTAEGMTEVTGGNTYIEDYVAAVVERNNGYENGIDDNDVRNAVIEVFGSYPSRKAALAELSRRYPDTALNEATEAIAQLEQERDDALAQIDADLRSELADAEANPSQYERAYEEEGTWNLQFDIYTGALRKARNEVSRMERDMQKAKLTQREKTVAMRTVKRAVVDMLKGDLGRYTRKRDIQALMDAVNEAQTLYAMQRAIDKAMLAINELRLRKETARMNNLLKMRISSYDSAIDPRIFFENMMKGSKNVDSAVRRLMNDYWRGVNSSGVDVAKGVDGDTARVLQFIRTHSNLTAELGKAPTEGDILKRCEAWRKELRGEAVETSIFSDTERKEIEALSPEVRERMADAVSVVEGYLMVQYQLQNMDEGVTNARQEIAAEKAQIKKLNKEIKALQGQKVAVTDGRIVDAKKEIEERKKKVEQINRDIASVRIMNAGAYIGVMPDILDAFSRLNAQVESLLMGGRVNLSTFNAKQEEHKRNLISMVLESIDNPEAQDWIDPKDHYKLMQKVRGNALVHFTTQHLGSLDHMLRRIDRNAPNGEGRVYNYFMPKITTAKNNIFTHTSETAEQLNDMANVLFGNSFKQIMRKAESKTLGRITLTRKKENGDTITEKKDVTIATALNILATWGQEMGKATLIEMGATEDTINQIREWLNNANPAWLQYADWVIKDFLPSRRTRYNEVFREMNGTDMPFEVNYFPIRRLDSAIHRNVDLSDPSFENKPSTVTGAIMTRTKNTVPVDLEVSFFSSLQDNIVEMEEWSAMAPIIRDFNTILSSSAVKKALNAIDAHFAKDVQDAAKVATMNYTGDTAKHDDIFWQMVLRTWASRLLGFKAFTALKQLASSVLFIPYAADREFIGRLVWYYIGGKDRLSNELYKRIGDGKLVAREVGEPSLNIKWALENSPMFRRRWESGVAGYNVFERELKFDNRKAWGRFLRLINEGIGKFTQLSMAPIALVDAYTVAAGMRAIYDFEMKKLLKEGYAKEEAKKIAMFRAEVFANKSQQSSEGEYLSPLQMERGWKSAFTIFQNAPMAQGRNIAEAYNELRRDGDKERAYIKKQETARLRKARAAEYEAIEATIAMEKEQGIITTEEQENLRREKLQKPINEDIERIATDKAVKTVRKAKTKAVLSLLFNAWLGQAVFNAMGIAPYLLFGDDDEEKAKLKIAWFYASIFAPLGTVVLGAQIMSALQGHNVVFSGALKEFEDGINEVIRYWRDNKYVDAVLSAAKFIESKLFGLDPTTYQRAVAGIENMFESGMSAENIFMALNAPDSQVRLLAGDRKEGETAQEYATRIMRLYTILSDPEYSDYYDVKTGKLIADAPAGSMTITQMRRLRKQYEMAYRSDVMRNKGLAEEWAAVLNTEEKYEEVVEALGFKANRTPADEAGYIDGEYRAPIEGLSEDDFYNLKYLARYAAAVAKYARTYLGGDEDAYLEYVRDEMEAKRELISEYNKILNK